MDALECIDTRAIEVMTFPDADERLLGTPFTYHDYQKELFWSGRVISVLYNAVRVKWYHVAPKPAPEWAVVR
jgi:hypothetical protein